MAEKEAKPKAEETKAADSGKEKVVKAERTPKREKVAWTIQRCKKAARRFSSEAEWKAGAPSSWKSASAHGWIAECVAQMPKSKVAGKIATPKRAAGADRAKKTA